MATTATDYRSSHLPAREVAQIRTTTLEARLYPRSESVRRTSRSVSAAQPQESVTPDPPCP